LKNERINLHRNLIATNLLLCIGAVMQGSKHIANDENPIGCNTLYVIHAYLFLASIVWMLNEGIYQFRLIYFVFIPSTLKFRYYVIFGYLFPAVIISCIYLPLVFVYPPTEESCWDNVIRYQWDKIPYGIAMVIMGINFVIMIYLLYVVFNKLKTSSCDNYQKAWKSARSFFMLVTLLGGQFLFTMYYPEPTFDEAGNGSTRIAFVIHFLIASPSFFICLFQVFISEDVWRKLKEKFQRARKLREITRIVSTKTMKSSVSSTKSCQEDDSNNDQTNSPMGYGNEAFEYVIENKHLDRLEKRRESFIRSEDGVSKVTINRTPIDNKDNESHV